MTEMEKWQAGEEFDPSALWNEMDDATVDTLLQPLPDPDDDDLEDYPDGDDEEIPDDDDVEDLKAPEVKPSPFKRKSLEPRTEFVAFYGPDGKLVASSTEAGQVIAGWIANGVPGVKGVEKDGAMVEEPTVISPDSPVFGLALLEEIERRGWKVGS